MNAIQLAFCIDDKFAPYLAVMLASITRVNDQKIMCHIVSEILTDDTKIRLNKLASDNFQISYYFLKQNGAQRFTVSSRYADRVSKTTYYRFLLSDILPENLDRVIYLDADMLCLGNIYPLWEATLGGKLAGVVSDGALCRQNRWKNLSLTTSNYFNAGMMVIDLVKWRDNKVTERLLSLSDSGRTFEYNDQDILNIVLQNDVSYLDMKWNTQTFHFLVDGEGEGCVIAHFTGVEKPWHCTSIHPLKAVFDEIRKLTDFTGDDILHLDAHDRALIKKIKEMVKPHEKLAIYGAGQKGRRIFIAINREKNNPEVIGFVDRNLTDRYQSIPIVSDCRAIEFDKICIASEAYEEAIINTLIDKNVAPSKIITTGRLA